MLKHKLAFLAVVLSAAALATGCQSAGRQDQPVVARDGVFIHVTKGDEDPHAVLMALKMATLMSADRDVLVYFDLRGVNIVLKDAKDVTFPTFDSSKTQLQALLDKGVALYACPGCLKAAGKEPKDLMAGVKVAQQDAFFSFTKGRILTLDY